jgi:hypothetical protein
MVIKSIRLELAIILGIPDGKEYKQDKRPAPEIPRVLSGRTQPLLA